MARSRIWVGSDHAAIPMREHVVAHLAAQGCEVSEVGPPTGGRSDYPDQAAEVASAVRSGDADLGILLCGTGIGMSIAANKIPGIRAALVHDLTTATLAAQHNRANVLCLGARLLAPELAVQLIDAWLETPFEERHQRRLDLVSKLETSA